VNSQTINGATSPGATINLSREAGAMIFSGNYTDWSEIANATGGAVSSVAAPITVVSREAGSGTRTGASLYFLGQNCVKTPLTYVDNFPTLDGYATGDVLATANTTPGAVTYASIDNSAANLTKVQLSGVTPTNVAAAAGQYDWWYEAYTQRAASIASPGGLALYNWLKSGELSNLATAPQKIDVLAIPNLNGNGAGTVPLSASGVIYLNPYTRPGGNCTIPTSTNSSPI
jgi:ABC-type phosphate transport system substrate-binding protein